MAGKTIVINKYWFWKNLLGLSVMTTCFIDSLFTNSCL